MTIKEFIKQDIDIDVYDSVCEDLGIAFVGPIELTDEGKSRFNDIMNVEVDIRDDVAIVVLDSEDWELKLDDCCALFNGAAGYCSSATYDKWFKG